MNDKTRTIEQSIQVNISPQEVFDALITPSAIRHWWEANRAIVHAVPGGFWTAAWGEQEDRPDYICGFTLAECSPPHRLVMTDPIYVMGDGAFPFSANNMVVEFEISSNDGQTQLAIRQRGFPLEPGADDYYEGCVAGWQKTLSNLETYLGERID